jgi:hypothetical protein
MIEGMESASNRAERAGLQQLGPGADNGSMEPEPSERAAVPRWSRRVVRRARRRAGAALEHLGPARLVPLGSSADPASIAFVSIYRYGNVPTLSRLLAQLPPSAEVRLWALDRVHGDVADLTVGSGPGGRLDLLNTLAGGLTGGREVLLIADDDVELVVGGLRRLLRAGTALGLDLFQAAHAAGSVSAFSFTRMRLLSFARETSFVEQGPLVVLSRRGQQALLPFPSNLGMGWGIELQWWRTAQDVGLRLGVVDAVSMRHLRGVERSYDTGPEKDRLQRELDRAGLDGLRELQRTMRDLGPLRAWWAVRRHRRAVETARLDALLPKAISSHRA